jgi:16S rRNA (cytosine1407-C5)-methyltransferase
MIDDDGSSVLERYRGFLTPAEMARLVEAVQRPLSPALRVNTLKIDVDQARRLWPEWYGWQIRPVPFCAAGWQVMGQPQDLGFTLEHKMGFYYIQDAASMLPVELFHFDEVSRPLVLDMAASPGGKTTHLACKLKDRGLVVANDVNTGRIAALRSNLQSWGTMSTAITHYPGERLGEWFPECFDQVLLDAPCSGEGLRTAERRKSRPVSAKGRRMLHHRQVRLLTCAFQALKPGGQVVYATCSLDPDENEAVLDALLKRYPQQATIEAPARVLAVQAPGLASDGERVFHTEVRRAVRLWPHLYDTAGFCAALVRKRDSVAVETGSPPSRPLAKVGLEAMSRQEVTGIVDDLRQAFGFDLRVVLDTQALTLWIRGQSVYAIPELFLSRLADLPCVAMGMLVGQRSQDGFIPSHELVARFDAQFTRRRLRLSDEQVKVWLAGRDLRGLGVDPFPSGAIVVMEDDKQRFLGRGKIQRGRIRNLLPRRLIY